MKKIILSTVIASMLTMPSVFAQSHSFHTLKDKFVGDEDVHHFAVSGFFARSILWMADEHEIYQAIKEVKTIRLMVIPQEAFKMQQVSLHGFRKVLKDDGFEELIRIKDSGDDVTLYLQSSDKKNKRYMILVEEDDEIVAIEMKGFIDPEFIAKHQSVAMNF